MASSSDHPATATRTSGVLADAGSLTDLLGLEPIRPRELEDSLSGQMVGGVVLDRPIGSGGMGCVYVGTQTKPRRPVAVKVMRAHYARPDMLRRFELEAETLARLEHPGIARMYAFGIHEADRRPRPYFVMEYVRGAMTLTDYVAARGLPLRDRLAIFAVACEAVAHVQQNGVIHRDLKPANILVDETGQPKVIDFGIARDTATTDELTSIGEVIGTRAYMSPEQFRRGSRDVDMRADVYSLGVVLFQVISDRLPFTLDGMSDYAAGDVVTHQPPARLTCSCGRLDADIVAIVGKCLAKDPAGRYSGAGELAADVRRYLAGAPVVARAHTPWETVALFCRRHRAATTAAAVTVAVLIGALALVTRSYRLELYQRQTANKLTESLERQRSEEVRLRQRAEYMLAFLKDSLCMPGQHPETAPIALEQWLRTTAVKARQQFAGPDAPSDEERLILSRVLLTIGTTLGGMGFPTDAADLLRESDQAVVSLDGGRSLHRPEVLNELGLALIDCGNYAGAAAVFREACDVALSQPDILDRSVTQRIAFVMLNRNLALAQMRLGELDAAAQCLAHVHEDLSEALGDDHHLVALALTSWGDVLLRLGDLVTAEERHRRAVQILEATGPGFERSLAAALNGLGEVCRLRGGVDEAIVLHERACDIHLRTVGSHHPALATSLGKLGEAYRVFGDLAKAATLCSEALTIREGRGLTDDPETAVIVERLGLIADARDQRSDAEAFYRRALRIRRDTLPADHADTHAIERTLQDFLERTGRMPPEPRAFTSSLEIR